MTYSAQAADRDLRHSTFSVVAQVLARDASPEQLLAARNLLREPGRLLPGPDLEAVLLAVSDRIAEVVGCDTADVPGAPIPPDDLSTL